MSEGKKLIFLAVFVTLMGAGLTAWMQASEAGHAGPLAQKISSAASNYCK